MSNQAPLSVSKSGRTICGGGIRGRTSRPEIGQQDFRNYDSRSASQRQGVLPAQPPHQTLDFVLAKKRPSTCALDTPADGRLGGDGVPQHAGRRQRPRHRPVADRAPAADGRGDPPRRPPALVHPDRADPRPGQGPLPVRRAAVGRRRRHVSRSAALFATRSSSPSSSPTTPTRRDRSTRRRCGIYDDGLRARQRPTCRGGTTSTCTTSSRITCPSRRCT